MKQLSICEVRSHFFDLVDEAHHGEIIIVLKAGKPWAKIVPLSKEKYNKFKFDTMKGKVKIFGDFNSPLPEEVIASFEVK